MVSVRRPQAIGIGGNKVERSRDTEHKRWLMNWMEREKRNQERPRLVTLIATWMVMHTEIEMSRIGGE